MSKPMPTIRDLPVTAIEVPEDRLRAVSEAKVSGLMELIDLFGYTTPIEVRHASTDRNILIDGAHRLEAMKRLGRETIPVLARDVSARDARGREISANLAAGMSPLQGAVFLAAWQKFYEELHPETRRGVPGAIARHGLQSAKSSFAEIAAESWAVSPSQIRKATAAVKRLSAEETQALDRAPKPVPFDAIEKIGKIRDAEERSAVVLKLALGAAKKVSEARKQLAAERGEAPEPTVQDPIEAAFNALAKAWSRAPLSAKKRFLFEHAREVWEAQNKGVPLNRWSEADE